MKLPLISTKEKQNNKKSSNKNKKTIHAAKKENVTSSFYEEIYEEMHGSAVAHAKKKEKLQKMLRQFYFKDYFENAQRKKILNDFFDSFQLTMLFFYSKEYQSLYGTQAIYRALQQRSVYFVNNMEKTKQTNNGETVFSTKAYASWDTFCKIFDSFDGCLGKQHFTVTSQQSCAVVSHFF